MSEFRPIISLSHTIHGAGIYANMWGILMGSMLPYIYGIHGSYGFLYHSLSLRLEALIFGQCFDVHGPCHGRDILSEKIGTATWHGRALRKASRWIRLAEKHRRYLRFIPCSLLGRTSQAKLRLKKKTTAGATTLFLLVDGRMVGWCLSSCIFAELRLEQCRFTIWLFHIAMRWKITIYNRSTIYKWAIFHGYVK